MLSRILKRLMETAGTSAIAHDEFLKLLQDKGCTVVDVREADEYARAIYPVPSINRSRDSILTVCRVVVGSY